MSGDLSLMTVNIDGKPNLSSVQKLLESTRPNIVCVQEIYEEDLRRLQDCGYPNRLYCPMTSLVIKGDPLSIGFAMLYDSSVTVVSEDIEYYVGKGEEPIVLLDDTSMETRMATEKRAVALSIVRFAGVTYKLATTHFLWVPDGKPDENQFRCVQKVLDIVRTAGEVVLCGDFNAARGGPIFGALAQAMRDNIPSCYETSIDPEIHRIRGLRAMVDGVFSTPLYRVYDVRMTFGISDHAAISCRVARHQ